MHIISKITIYSITIISIFFHSIVLNAENDSGMGVAKNWGIDL